MKLPRALLQAQNDIATMLGLLYSPLSVEAYTEMAEDEFNISWGEMSHEEANLLLILLGTAEQTGTIHQQDPGFLSLMPPIVLKGLSNIYIRLSPYKDLLVQIRNGEVSHLESKILAGEIALSRREGISLSDAQFKNILANAA